ncbi:calcium uptake protein, mitochondrial-like isoform X2 [Tripterygium wilfordii]|uniref:calcium uptake protein, mitochondrial-like isoform X2 n=1 Tax=Tripterygium wilfordii TaxID=458696 RepID=UPI0018F85A7C|nr:calcium uptake protein, mitochondrial-like isoform X2 [Tripterygium wilfordii]
MQALTSLERSAPSIFRLSSIQRFQSRQVSNSPSLPSSSLTSINDADKQQNTGFGTFTRWFSGIGVISGLGLLYWSNTDSPSDFGFGYVKNSVIINTRKLSLPESSSSFLFGDDYRRNIFFKYEKRIRLRSPPEKVFEYFASFQTSEGKLLMKPADLMRAVVPVFPPSESHLVRDGYLSGERRPGELRCPPSEFFMLFDVNCDGLISFQEYIFFVTILSIPESSFSVAFKMFDINNNGEISKEEFKKVMALMRSHNRQGAFYRDGPRTRLKFEGSVENGGLMEYFFGKDGKSCLKHDNFVQFLRKLQDEIMILEFSHYDYKRQGTISAKDFALSMVTSADMSHLDRLLNRVDELNNKPRLRDIRITLDEFRSFAELRKTLQPLSLALFSYGKVNGLLTRMDFQRAASHFERVGSIPCMLLFIIVWLWMYFIQSIQTAYSII